MTAPQLLPDQVKHLEMLQDVISRMASNSFVIKSWAVTVAAALFALTAETRDPWFASVTLIPTSVFWIMDAFYLQQERKFRRLYDGVRLPGSTIPPFSMDTSSVVGEDLELRSAVFSRSVSPIYAALVLATIVIVSVLVWHSGGDANGTACILQLSL